MIYIHTTFNDYYINENEIESMIHKTNTYDITLKMKSSNDIVITASDKDETNTIIHHIEQKMLKQTNEKTHQNLTQQMLEDKLKQLNTQIANLSERLTIVANNKTDNIINTDDISIDVLNLENIHSNKLYRHKIKTISDLRKLNRSQLREINGFGLQSRKIIYDAVLKYTGQPLNEMWLRKRL